MEGFELVRVIPYDIDPCGAKEMKLFEEFHPACSSFMVYVGFRNQACSESIPDDPDAEFDVLSLIRHNISPGFFKDLRCNTHVEASRMEWPDTFFSASDAAGGQQ